MWCFWLIAAGVFFVAEIITVGFLVFWLGIGALLAMVASIFTDSIAIQTAVFVISSAILIPLTKPLADKFINKKDTINILFIIPWMVTGGADLFNLSLVKRLYCRLGESAHTIPQC